jgi:hypothetical protein
VRVIITVPVAIGDCVAAATVWDATAVRVAVLPTVIDGIAVMEAITVMEGIGVVEVCVT